MERWDFRSSMVGFIAPRLSQEKRDDSLLNRAGATGRRWVVAAAGWPQTQKRRAGWRALAGGTNPVITESCPPAWECQQCSARSEEHTSELQSRPHLVCRLLLEKKKTNNL